MNIFGKLFGLGAGRAAAREEASEGHRPIEEVDGAALLTSLKLGAAMGAEEWWQDDPYVVGGIGSSAKIADSLQLPGWREGIPMSYTREEVIAINRELSTLKGQFDEYAAGKGGREALVSPVARDAIRSACAATALAGLGGRWTHSDSEDLPVDWKNCVSSYLKAWRCDLAPRVLLDMAELLAKAGYKNEAKHALQAVLLFPAFAPHYFAQTMSSEEIYDFASGIAGRARELLKPL